MAKTTCSSCGINVLCFTMWYFPFWKQLCFTMWYFPFWKQPRRVFSSLPFRGYPRNGHQHSARYFGMQSLLYHACMLYKMYYPFAYSRACACTLYILYRWHSTGNTNNAEGYNADHAEKADGADIGAHGTDGTDSRGRRKAKDCLIK